MQEKAEPEVCKGMKACEALPNLMHGKCSYRAKIVLVIRESAELIGISMQGSVVREASNRHMYLGICGFATGGRLRSVLRLC